MKDVTSTSFGLIIAFVLPGFAALYSLSFWSCSVYRLFNIFLSTQSNVGLFLMVLIAAVVISLQITLLRWLIFEEWICRSQKIGDSYFENLGITADRLSAFRAVVDEHYRYHQFWGGMVIVIPLFGIGWLRQVWNGLVLCEAVGLIAGLGALELLTGCAARRAYMLYLTRARAILK